MMIPFWQKKLMQMDVILDKRILIFKKLERVLRQKIIGVTCHNSKKLIKKAIQNKADYIAIGAFFHSKTKKTKFKANIDLIEICKKNYKNTNYCNWRNKQSNYKKLLLNKANFLAISGYVWKNKKYKPIEAIEKLR